MAVISLVVLLQEKNPIAEKNPLTLLPTGRQKWIKMNFTNAIQHNEFDKCCWEAR